MTLTLPHSFGSGARIANDSLRSSQVQANFDAIKAAIDALQAAAFDPASPGPIGGTTPGSGAFTTLSASGLISANGGQIAFPATQVPSADANTLDDYEEGAWTPTLTFATPGNLSVAYAANSRIGVYTKVGRTVFLSFIITTSTFTHTTASGACRITGLPFTSANVTNQNAYGGCTWQGITKANYSDVVPAVFANNAIVNFTISGSGQNATNLTAADMPTGGTVVLNGNVPFIV